MFALLSLLALPSASLQCPGTPLISELIHNCLAISLPPQVYFMSLHNMSFIYLYGIITLPSASYVMGLHFMFVK